MTEKIKVVGIIASENGATLITQEGKTEELKSSDYRTHALIEKITPLLALHKVAEVDLDTFDATKAVEAKTGGKVKFFRVLTNKLKRLFGSSADRAIGPSYNEGMIEAIGEGVKNQTGVATLSEKQIKDLAAENVPFGVPAKTTLVAVVDSTPIIGAETLQKQIDAAAKVEGRPVGFEKFMQRLAAVARERKHTLQELLKFVEQADLPIADDGCIIGYKTLKVLDAGEGSRYFVDHHSGKVKQRLGSLVSMPVEKVDDNRRVLCSNGLHIARRKYLTSYGDGRNSTIVLAKIAPEDVISVPMGEPDKMRCAAYHIVAELPAAAHGFIRSNKPMTQNAEAAEILGNVIKGNHIGVVEKVEILGAMGGNLRITKVTDEVAEPERNKTLTAKVLDDEVDKKLNPLVLNKQVEEIQKAAKVEEAAATGNLAAALATSADPAPKKPASNDNNLRKRVHALTTDGKKRDAVVAVMNGMAKREAERKFGVPARTIGRLIEKLAA